MNNFILIMVYDENGTSLERNKFIKNSVLVVIDSRIICHHRMF